MVMVTCDISINTYGLGDCYDLVVRISDNHMKGLYIKPSTRNLMQVLSDNVQVNSKSILRFKILPFSIFCKHRSTLFLNIGSLLYCAVAAFNT